MTAPGRDVRAGGRPSRAGVEGAADQRGGVGGDHGWSLSGDLSENSRCPSETITDKDERKGLEFLLFVVVDWHVFQPVFVS